MDFTSITDVLLEWLRVAFNVIGILGIICLMFGACLFWVFKKLKWKALIIAVVVLILILVLVWKFNIDLPGPAILLNLSSEFDIDLPDPAILLNLSSEIPSNISLNPTT